MKISTKKNAQVFDSKTKAPGICVQCQPDVSKKEKIYKQIISFFSQNEKCSKKRWWFLKPQTVSV